LIVFDNQTFASLVADGRPTGEVVGMTELIIRLRGLEGVSVNSLVLFEDGSRGLVRGVRDQITEVLSLSLGRINVGMLAVLEQSIYQTGVGEALIGRIVNVLGEPLDGKGPVSVSEFADVFTEAPGITERAMLNTHLITGVAIVDSLFPFVLGQRLAILGDNKSGKSTFLRQLTHFQASVGQIIVYVLIAKRQVDIDTLVSELTASGAIKNTIIVVASSFDALSMSYLAPYVACAMAEYLWKAGKNVIVVYDDLSNHAKIYRELSLLSEKSPGRDSYPGDMFYAHSSLLERAGKLAKGAGTLTSLAVVLTPNDDITAYLPTSVMSITDGQIIFDLESFRKGIRPAVNVGLSVSRVGGRVQTRAWKEVSSQLFRKLADYHQAAEFAQFGSELAPQAQADLALGKSLYEIFKQTSSELYPLTAQYLMLAVALLAAGRVSLNVVLLKQQALTRAAQLGQKDDPTSIVHELLAASTVQVQA
jgi:F-type H+/Na+-transporting ATPase subunit alpha